MKKFKKIITMFSMIILTTGITLTGCGEKKKDPPKEVKTLTTPEITAEAYYKFCLYGDKTKFVELGLPTVEFDSISKDRLSKIRNDIRNLFSESAMVISDDEIEKVLTAEVNTLKKLSAKIETTQSKETVTVKIATTYIDISSIYAKAENDALKKVTASKFKNETQYKNKLKELYINNLITYINNTQPSADAKEQNFTFARKIFDENNKSLTIWAPEDFTRFQRDITKMTLNQTS